MNKFTQNNDRSIEIMLADYEKQKQEIDKIDFRNLDEEDKKLLADHADSKDFLIEVRNALDFTKSSTMVVLDDNNPEKTSFNCVSLMQNATEYANTLVTLTGGFDKKMLDTLETTRTEPIHPETMSVNEYNATIKAPLKDKIISAAIAKEMGAMDASKVMQQRDVSDLVEAIERTKVYRKKYGIEDENIIAGTLSTFFAENESERINTISVMPLEFLNQERLQQQEQEQEQELQNQQEQEQISAQQVAEMYNDGYRSDDDADLKEDFTLTSAQLTATVILLDKFESFGITKEAEELAAKELKEKDIPVEIVESNDGFVMNMDALTPENEQAINEKIENGNEVIHDEVPQETTIDPAEAKGKVKLEEAHDIGSKETEQIEAGADLGSLNEKYDEGQPDENKKTKKHNIEIDR